LEVKDESLIAIQKSPTNCTDTHLTFLTRKNNTIVEPKVKGFIVQATVAQELGEKLHKVYTKLNDSINFASNSSWISK
jgi:hypothetical protein